MSSASTTKSGSTGVSTRAHLLNTAERLFAERGMSAIPTRAILRAAEQRNESALQYHFGGRGGLIEALYSDRGLRINRERQRMFDELEGEGAVGLRKLCAVALMPPVRIAQRDPEFVLFLKIVGELVFVPNERLKESRERIQLDTVGKVVRLIRGELDLPKELVARRLDLIDRMATLLLAQRARAEQPFEGAEADLFFQTTLDAMVEILRGPVSAETERALQTSGSRS